MHVHDGSAAINPYQFLITWPHNKPITTQHNTFVERSITYVLVDLFFCSKNPSTHSQCAKMEGTIKRQIITNGRMRKAKYTVIISLCLLSVLYYVLAVKFYAFNIEGIAPGLHQSAQRMFCNALILTNGFATNDGTATESTKTSYCTSTNNIHRHTAADNSETLMSYHAGEQAQEKVSLSVSITAIKASFCSILHGDLCV